MEKNNEKPVSTTEIKENDKDQKEKTKTATPIVPYEGNSKLKEHNRLTPSGLKPE